MENALTHIPVLLQETMEPLLQNTGKVYVDGTIGGGGHLEYLLRHKNQALVLGFDRDAEAIERVSKRFPEAIRAGRLKLFHASFTELPRLMHDLQISGIDGMVMDLGFSSFQIDSPERGFSFMLDGPLDMRFDQSRGKTAADMVNTLDRDDLAKLFYQWGEEKYSRRIADAIVERRKTELFTDTRGLAETIAGAIPKKDVRQRKTHVATKTFQALRIAVNNELGELEKFLELIPDLLNPGGVLSVLSFHSLEDRVVKMRFRYLSADCICPKHILTCERCHKPPGKILLKKPIIASEQEVRKNPRARSAKLRVFVRN